LLCGCPPKKGQATNLNYGDRNECDFRFTLQGICLRVTIQGLVLQSTAPDWSPASRAGLLHECFVRWLLSVGFICLCLTPPLQSEQENDVTVYKSFNLQDLSVQFIELEPSSSSRSSLAAKAQALSPSAAAPAVPLLSSSTIFNTSVSVTLALTVAAVSLAPLSVSASCRVPSLQTALNDKQIVSLYTFAFALSELSDKAAAAQVKRIIPYLTTCICVYAHTLHQ
jgi:hypothetical protein